MQTKENCARTVKWRANHHGRARFVDAFLVLLLDLHSPGPPGIVSRFVSAERESVHLVHSPKTNLLKELFRRLGGGHMCADDRHGSRGSLVGAHLLGQQIRPNLPNTREMRARVNSIPPSTRKPTSGKPLKVPVVASPVSSRVSAARARTHTPRARIAARWSGC